jgi:hypothetical protein
MNARLKKIILLVLAVALLFGSGQLEKSLNHDRVALGLTISEPLQDAPPVLALATQALGGFRGLISNFLWMRASDLQMNDKYFESAQLANWITDLEPHFAQVWVYEGWNMAYNISVKFPNFSDRWRWVENGIELLRDRGLKYNPDNTLIYQNLGWFFQHKMGQNLDDANAYYKTQWAQEMTPFFGPYGTNFGPLVSPQTAEDRTNVYVLTNKYKIDPVFAQKVNTEWGPLDWRLPEANAIYWGSLGLEKAQEHPDKVTQSDLITLRRLIYQSMMQAFEHGRIIANPFTHTAELGPNLALIPKVNDAYETEMKEDPNDAQHISTGHRNFLRNAVYYLYEQNDVADAQKWFKYLGEKYPDKYIIDGSTDLPKDVTLDEYCVRRVAGDVKDTSQVDITAAIKGMLVHAYEDIAIGQDDRGTGFILLAHKTWTIYMNKMKNYKSDIQRVGLAPFEDINQDVLNLLLDPQNGLPYAARATIRTYLRMPPETAASTAASTNAVPGTPVFINTNLPNATSAPPQPSNQ